jgi:hypothetical protein
LAISKAFDAALFTNTKLVATVEASVKNLMVSATLTSPTYLLPFVKSYKMGVPPV